MRNFSVTGMSRAVLVASLIGLGMFSTVVSAMPAGAVPPLVIPSANIASNPNYLMSGNCVGSGAYPCQNPCILSTYDWPLYTNDPECTSYLLEAINNAKAELGETPIALPTNWYRLTPQKQLFVITDLERISNGYPPYVGLNGDLDAEAQSAATHYEDPGFAPGFSWGNDPTGYPGFGGAWATGFSSLAADYMWMYNDGWGGSGDTSNIACTSPSAEGCWGHREEILGSGINEIGGAGLACTTCEMGAGWVSSRGSGSWVVLIERPKGVTPATTFKWSSEAPYLSGKVATTTTVPTIPVTTIPDATTSTTVPTTFNATGAPSAVALVKISINPSKVEVRWNSVGSPGITTVMLRVYKGASCAVPVHSARLEYNPARNVQWGYITSSGANIYSPTSPYSARVKVTNAAGAQTGRCLPLGIS